MEHGAFAAYENIMKMSHLLIDASTPFFIMFSVILYLIMRQNVSLYLLGKWLFVHYRHNILACAIQYIYSTAHNQI